MKLWVLTATICCTMLAASVPAQADDPAQYAQPCVEPDKDANLRLERCTWAINSGYWQETQLFQIYIGRGKAHADLGEHRLAIADYDTALRMGDDHVAYIRRGVSERALGMYSECVRDFTKAMPMISDQYNGYLGRAECYSDLKKYPEAIRDFTSAIARGAHSPVTYGERAFAYEQLKRYREAGDDYIKAEDDDRTYLMLDLEMAEKARIAPEKDAALKADVQAAEVKAKWISGVEHHNKGEHDAAIADFGAVIAAKPKIAEAYYWRAKSYYAKGQYEQAAADLSTVIGLKPDMTDVWCDRANAYFAMKRYSDAIADYTRAIAVKPDQQGAFLYRGQAYAATGQYDKALTDYAEALRLKADDAYAYSGRGAVYARLGRYDEAIADDDTALRLRPDLSVAARNRDIAVKAKAQTAGGTAAAAPQ